MRLFTLAICIALACPALADPCDLYEKQLRAAGDLGSAALATNLELATLPLLTPVSPQAKARLKAASGKLMEAIETYNDTTKILVQEFRRDCR